MNVQCLSTIYKIRILDERDVDILYDCCAKNALYYKYHPPFATKADILEDIRALPPGKTSEDKFFIGYFQDERLIAFMDLILGYPAKETALIGLFMVHADWQRKGVGSTIVRECKTALHRLGYARIRLGTDRGNPQSNAFWAKNGFAQTSETDRYIIRESAMGIPQCPATQTVPCTESLPIQRPGRALTL